MWDYLLLVAVLLVVILLVICSLTGCSEAKSFLTSLAKPSELLSPELQANVNTTIDNSSHNSSITPWILGGVGVVCFITFAWRLVAHHLKIAKMSQATNRP